MKLLALVQRLGAYICACMLASASARNLCFAIDFRIQIQHCVHAHVSGNPADIDFARISNSCSFLRCKARRDRDLPLLHCNVQTTVPIVLLNINSTLSLVVIIHAYAHDIVYIATAAAAASVSVARLQFWQSQRRANYARVAIRQGLHFGQRNHFDLLPRHHRPRFCRRRTLSRRCRVGVDSRVGSGSVFRVALDLVLASVACNVAGAECPDNDQPTFYEENRNKLLLLSSATQSQFVSYSRRKEFLSASGRPCSLFGRHLVADIWSIPFCSHQSYP